MHWDVDIFLDNATTLRTYNYLKLFQGTAIKGAFMLGSDPLNHKWPRQGLYDSPKFVGSVATFKVTYQYGSSNATAASMAINKVPPGSMVYIYLGLGSDMRVIDAIAELTAPHVELVGYRELIDLAKQKCCPKCPQTNGKKCGCQVKVPPPLKVDDADAEMTALPTLLCDFTQPNKCIASAGPAPPAFDVTYHTTAGNFTVHVILADAPPYAQRFWAVSRVGYQDGARFYRVDYENSTENFVVQFGSNGRPEIDQLWGCLEGEDAALYPKGEMYSNATWSVAKPGNQRGTVAFSMDARMGSHKLYPALTNCTSKEYCAQGFTTNVYINYGNNARLDAAGFSIFGSIDEAEMSAVVDKLYQGYGECADMCAKANPGHDTFCHGKFGPAATGMLISEYLKGGEAYLAKSFPKLDKVVSVSVSVPATPKRGLSLKADDDDGDGGPLLRTECGQHRGQRIHVQTDGGTRATVEVFKGVTYAGAKVRWAPPTPLACADDGVAHDATVTAVNCPGLRGSGPEDCLNLVVWKPAAPATASKTKSSAPAMVYFHGGDLTGGSNSGNFSKLAAEGVVIIDVAYRLAAFGS